MSIVKHPQKLVYTVSLATSLALAACGDDSSPRDGLEDPGDSVSSVEGGSPGAYIANFELTFYWVAFESAYGGAKNTGIYKASGCQKILTVSSSFASALKLEGTGKLEDGRLVNYHKSCGCSSYGCSVVADEDYPWGIGVQNRPLFPNRSIAVAKDVISYGSWVYAPELDGLEIPAGPWGGAYTHDGCLRADDTGSAINGSHIDYFSGTKQAYLDLIGGLGSYTKLYQGGTRCDDSVGDLPDGGGPGGDDDDDPPDGGDDGGAEDPPDDLGTEACFPGADGSGDTCLEVVALPAGAWGYDYPAPYGGDSNYRQPIRYLDLKAIDGSTKIAPNFTLDEIAQDWKGQWGVVQPHAIVALQNFRDQLGPIKINSGYRRPAYNSSVGGAKHSRHMYGDAFDMKPISAPLYKLENACSGQGGKLVEYSSHVHCDFRYDPVDPIFYGDAAIGEIDPGPEFSAVLEEEDGEWSAIGLGFDEGEPLVRWDALDDEGTVIGSHIGETFVPPEGTATVRALVGAQVEVEAEMGLKAAE